MPPTLKTVGGVIAAVVAFAAYVIVAQLELLKTAPPASTDYECEAVRGVRGAEDLIQLDDNTVLTSHLDHTVLGKTPRADDPTVSDPWRLTQPGHLWVLHLPPVGRPATEKPTMRKAIIRGRPEGVPLRAHGIGLWDGWLLAVVNHGYDKGGERVERFRLSREGDDVVLDYLNYVNFPLLNGAVNDVIPVSETEFYATQWLWQADPPNGRGFGFVAELVKTGVFTSFFQVRLTHIYYCNTTDPVAEAETACKIVGPPGLCWNGITADPERNLVYISDVMGRQVYMSFRRADGELDVLARIDLPHMGDNIDYNHKTGMLEMGGMTLFGACYMQWIDDYAKALKLDDTAVPKGGPSPSGLLCPSHQLVIDPVTRKVQTPFLHDGSLLGGFSSGLTVRTHPRTIVLSSFNDDGVLVCTQKPQQPAQQQ